MYRLRDLFIALPGLLLLSPLLLLIMGALWLTQGRVFFRQQRPGRYARPFTLLKFSTLYDAPHGQAESVAQQGRLTPVGRYLRRYSLDELPQLINVIRGEMSLVGPRPLLMAYLPLYTEAERRRHDVLPGITGLAQIRGRNQLSFKARFRYDCWYVAHRSMALDCYILRCTLRQALGGEGVYADAETTSAPFDGTN